jgi:hypothetical protein
MSNRPSSPALVRSLALLFLPHLLPADPPPLHRKVRPIPIRPYSTTYQASPRPLPPPQRVPHPRPRSGASVLSRPPSSYHPPPPPQIRPILPPAARPTSAVRPTGAKPRVSFDLGEKAAAGLRRASFLPSQPRSSNAPLAPPTPARSRSSILSSAPIPRPRTVSLPTPPPSRQSTSNHLPALPSHLAFMSPSRPPPPIPPSMHIEGSSIPSANLIIIRGKARSAITHWEHTAVVEAYSALRAHDQLQRESYCRMQPGGRSTVVLDEVSKDAFYLLRPSIMLLRFLAFSQPILRVRSHFIPFCSKQY